MCQAITARMLSLQIRRGKHRSGRVQIDDVERMKVSYFDTLHVCPPTTKATLDFILVLFLQERASHIKTFIYVKIPQTTLNITYKVYISYMHSVTDLLACIMIMWR